MFDFLGSAALISAVLVLARAMAATMFAYKLPNDASDGDRRAVPRYMSVLVTHHHLLRLGGGGGILCFYLLLRFVDIAPDWLRYAAQSLLIVALAVYSATLSWRSAALASKRRRGSEG